MGSGEYVKLIYGTVSVLVLAIIIKEMPLGTQIIKAGVLQISNELEEASSARGRDMAGRFSPDSTAALEADHAGCGNYRLYLRGERYSDRDLPSNKSKPNALAA